MKEVNTRSDLLPLQSTVSPFPWAYVALGIILIVGGIWGGIEWVKNANSLVIPYSFLTIFVLAGLISLGFSLKKYVQNSRTQQIDHKKIGFHENLKSIILSTPTYIPTQQETMASIYTPVHQIHNNIFLGNYRGYLSVDPAFVKKHSTTESREELGEMGLNLTTEKYREMAQGCSQHNIKLIVSVTQFKPKDSVPHDDWSRFEPRLEELGIKRIQIKAHDDDDAWSIIEPQLESIFVQIDEACFRGENVLIHCVEGSSRSSAVVYAYLMSRCKVTLDQAFNFVRSRRPHVQIKPIMKKGLEAFYAQIQTLS